MCVTDAVSTSHRVLEEATVCSPKYAWYAVIVAIRLRKRTQHCALREVSSLFLAKIDKHLPLSSTTSISTANIAGLDGKSVDTAYPQNKLDA